MKPLTCLTTAILFLGLPVLAGAQVGREDSLQKAQALLMRSKPLALSGLSVASLKKAPKSPLVGQTWEMKPGTFPGMRLQFSESKVVTTLLLRQGVTGKPQTSEEGEFEWKHSADNTLELPRFGKGRYDPEKNQIQIWDSIYGKGFYERVK